MLCCVVVVAVDWEFSLLSFPPVVFGGVEFFFFFLLLMREKEGRLLSLSFFSFRQTLFNKEARVVYVVALSVSAVATRQKEADQGWRLMLFFFSFVCFLTLIPLAARCRKVKAKKPVSCRGQT